MSDQPSYEDRIHAAVSARHEGWDFSWLRSRTIDSAPSWSYEALAGELLQNSESVVDVDTGGGELFEMLAPLGKRAAATEGWPPNVEIARQRLARVDVAVTEAQRGTLPFPSGEFDLILNRHGALDAREAFHALCPGGLLLTQQVGSDDCEELNTLLGAPRGHPTGSWTKAKAEGELRAAGFAIRTAEEEWPQLSFLDIGAVVFQLQAVPWQIPGFAPEEYESALRRLDAVIRRDGPLVVHTHRFLLVAEKP
jgi:SAM-dependent methyltransferase